VQPAAARNFSAQLAFAFPKSSVTVNNRDMSKADGEADKQEAAKKLRNKALRLLTTREHSREELLRKLAQAKARRARQDAQSPTPAKDDIERVVDELAAQGWQSDDRYAEAIVRRLMGQASRRYIEDKLAQTGIKKDAAKLALEALEQDDVEVAKALWARRFGEPPADDRERQKQIRFLLSRGFHLGDAFKLVPKAIAAAPAYGGRFNRQRPGDTSSAARGRAEQGTSSDEVSDETNQGNELTRTSTLRKNSTTGGFGMNRSARWGASNKAAAADSAGGDSAGEDGKAGKTGTTGFAGSGTKSGGPQLRQSAFKRARPWGARNDADPSDADVPSEPSDK
jgi:regulatory protein